MMLLATDDNWMPARCKIPCNRKTSSVRCCTSVLQYRVKSRTSRISRGGTKLPCSKPHSSNCAIAPSLASVLRPGTFLICAAFTSSTSNPSSSTQYTGFQYSPVDSIATCVTCHCSSQSRSARRSPVLVPNVARVAYRFRPSPGTRTQALIVSRCTSKPHTRSRMTSILPPSSSFGGTTAFQTLPCVLPYGAKHLGVPLAPGSDWPTDSQYH